jgi:hypothetical protein
MQNQAPSEISSWFTGRLPDGWFSGPAEVGADADEILVVGTLAEEGLADDAAREARITRFREETREQRMKIASEAERRFGRKVSWGVQVGPVRKLFTTLSTPVMTRLRQPERSVLDTLVASGVARSRSEALAWCVKLVGQHQADWLQDLKEALAGVEQARAKGPQA